MTNCDSQEREERMMRTRMKDVIYGELKPKMVSLFWRTAENGRDFVMEGVPVYNEKAQFVGGKVINMGCYTVLEFLKDTEEYDRGLKALGRLIAQVSDLPMETWGILNGITGLYRLKRAGLLETVVDPETLKTLKKVLDWRTFVDVKEHYKLIHKPTNYYGVAFGIARYRELLGWEKEGDSHVLLDRLMEHIKQYSGELSYMDETAGSGRFDRYSILIPSEIISLIMATGMETPEKIRVMLKNSVRIFLRLADDKGLGFAYGRSIGAYGDTAALEVLSAAAEAGGIYEGREQELAYGYSVRLLGNLMDFWYDEEMQSVNMWEKGRKTDGYRNKNRILGENMSLFMQMINTYEHWVRAGWKEREITADYGLLLAGIEKHFFVRFAEGEYERALAVVRDQGHVWSLPFINGGKKYYETDPYLPVPQENLVLDQVPGQNHGNMVPELVLESGCVLRPVSFIRKIETEEAGDTFVITCHQDSLCLMGGEEPEPAKGKVTTIYRFMPGKIIRRDEFVMAPETCVREIRLKHLVYSEGGRTEADESRVEFEKGAVSALKTSGYGSCQVMPVPEDGSFDTPRGRLKTQVMWRNQDVKGRERIAVEWELEYGEKD